MSGSDLKDRAWWEQYFAVDGGWERHGGRRQTHIFAQHFIAHAKLPLAQPFSLLDAGCGLGDALLLFSQAFPNAVLHGIDFSATAVARSRDLLGKRAQVRCGDLDSISGRVDIIYCSNTLEHFPDFAARARNLLSHCKELYVMVPYQEFHPNGGVLVTDPGQHHQHTFESRDFDYLMREGSAQSVTSCVFSCPGAWGWSPVQHLAQSAKNLLRLMRGRARLAAPRQILYCIKATRVEENVA